MVGNDEHLTGREFALLESCLHLKQVLDGDVRRHLSHGFVQRLLMLQAGRKNLLRDADPRNTAPRSAYMASELSLQANAYYLNVRGALDNLAWCLHYRWALLPAIDEAHGNRQGVYLFGARFQTALREHDSGLATALQSKNAWATELSERRDPAAHRIPLQVPPTVLTGQDESTFRSIEGEAAAVFASGRYEDGMALIRSTARIGAFVPVLVQATSGGPVTVDLHWQVAFDHDSFLFVAEAVIRALGGKEPSLNSR